MKNLIVGILLGWLFAGVIAFVIANSPLVSAKAIDPGCYPFGTAGNIIVVRCVDDDGNVFFANSAGFLMPAGN